jgi:hypothetical protein
MKKISERMKRRKAARLKVKKAFHGMKCWKNILSTKTKKKYIDTKTAPLKKEENLQKPKIK